MQDLVKEKIIGGEMPATPEERLALTPNQFKPAEPINLPETPVPAPLPTLSNYAQQYYDQANTQGTVETTANNLSTTLTDLLGQTGGQAQDLANEQQKAGVFEKMKSYQSLLSQINERKTQYDKLSADLEANTAQNAFGTNVRASVVLGQQGAIARQKAAEVEMLNSQAQTIAGDYNMALESAQRATDLKYAPILEQISIKQAQLKAIEPMLTAEQKKKSDALTYALAQQKADADKKIQTEKDLQSLSIEAAKNGAPQSIISAIAKSGDIMTALNYASGFLSNPLEKALKQAQFDKINADIAIGKVIKLNEGDMLYDTTTGTTFKNPKTSIAGGGGGGGGTTTSKMDTRVKQIVAMNPGEWGHAADQIDKEFGQGTATLYDAYLKSVYSPSESNKPMTATQSLNYNYATRLQQAGQVFDKIEKNIASYDPISYFTYSKAPNLLKPTDIQEQEQAQRNFINAVLRKESGAVISPSEFESGARQYFPQPGDSAEVLAQKKKNRQLVEQNFFKMSGVSNEETLASQVQAKGYDYERLKADGYSDEEIKQSIGL